MAEIIIPKSASSPGGIDTRDRDPNGNLTTNQIGSQFWMNGGYAGDEPTMDVKAAFSTAEYASGWIGNYEQILSAGGTPVSKNVEIMETYPAASSPVLKALWKDFYAISPQAAYDQRKAESTQTAALEAQSKVITPATAAIDRGDAALTTGLRTGAETIGSAASTIGQYALYIMIGVIVIIVAAVVMAKTHIGGTSA